MAGSFGNARQLELQMGDRGGRESMYDEDKEEWRKNRREVERSDLNIAGGSTLRLG